MNAGPASFPRATAVPIPAVTVATSRVAFCHGVIAVFSTVSFCAGGATTGGGTGRGAGGSTSPLWSTIDPRTTSSSRLTANSLEPSPMERRNFVMLFEYNVEDCVGKRKGRSVYPREDIVETNEGRQTSLLTNDGYTILNV